MGQGMMGPDPYGGEDQPQVAQGARQWLAASASGFTAGCYDQKAHGYQPG